MNPSALHPSSCRDAQPQKTREFAEILGDEFGSDLTACAELPAGGRDRSDFRGERDPESSRRPRSISGLVVADDSGLEVDALNGAPDLFRAVCRGRATDRENVANFSPNWPCEPGGEPPRRGSVASWRWRTEARFWHLRWSREGRIITRRLGLCGFGYDPVFVPEASHRPLAELACGEKSDQPPGARDRALRALLRGVNSRRGTQGGGAVPAGRTVRRRAVLIW